MNTHRPCLYLALAMAAGIFLGRWGLLSWYWWGILSGALIVLSLFRGKFANWILHLTMICLGAFYYQTIYIFPANHIAFLSYQDQKNLTAIEGLVDSDVQFKPTNYGTKRVFEFQLSRIQLDGHWQEVQGKILVNCFKSLSISYGDKLQMEGVLFKSRNNPKERFSYQQYLEDHGMFFILSVGKKKSVEILAHDQGQFWNKFSIQIKHKFKSILERYLEPQEVSMIQAMTLGDRSFLTKDMYALFSKTGTSHILAISGMNMAIIGAMIMFILKVLRVQRRAQFVLTVLFLFMYCLICGWSASVVRSVLMAAVVLSSFCLEYEAEAMNSLGVAALTIFLLNPRSLFDIGFQLSFICVFMIVLLQPLFNSWIEQNLQRGWWKPLLQALSISLIASIGISPLIAYQFDIVSLIAILANVPIVPLADLVIILSLGLVTVGLICPPLALAFAGSLKAVFNFTLILIAWFAQIPGGYFYIHQLNVWFVLIYYGVLFLVAGGMFYLKCRGVASRTI